MNGIERPSCECTHFWRICHLRKEKLNSRSENMSFGVHSTTSCLGFTVLYLFSFVNIYTCFLFHLLQKDSSIENLYLIASFASWFVSCIF